MTKWREIGLRTLGEPWPGLSTRNGRLMKRMGELADCKNVSIGPFDTLYKRLGFVRAFDERFNGVVCGLFRYTDHCNNEYVLVADQSGITIRTPTALPTGTLADCYPFDNFSVDGPLDEANWRNAARYEAVDDEMRMVAGGAVVEPSDLQLTLDAATRWFKDACSSSYQTEITFSFSDSAVGQRIALIIRGAGELDDFGALMAVLDYAQGGDYLLRIVHRRANDSFVELARLVLDSATDANQGTLAVAYNATELKPSATLTLGTAAARELTVETPLLAIDDANLGLVSALALVLTTDGLEPIISVAVIDGGPV